MVKNKRVILVSILLSLIIVFLIYLNQKHGYFILSYPQMKETYVSFRFDDGLKSQKEAFKILKENNMTGSIYVITSKINTTIEWEKDYYLNWEEIKEASNFMEIGSHTISHKDLTLLPFSKAKKEIEDSKKILEEKGFEINTFVYPGGKYNPQIVKIAEKNYECASTQDVGTNYIPIRPHLLKDFTFRKDNNEETIKRVIKKGKWNILTFHDIGNISNFTLPSFYKKVAEENSISIEYFSKIVEYVKENNIKVITIEDGCKKFKQ